ncbi:disintegrin and metalloproteinase domain-containing protein 8 [Pteronotus mesoamericanus]|uniref:disintegrin and metalloproteinase domain-containing protein 8 n=1 Tax=Pteronotus mesoamericanus TaxID=1884717 RepID=UPI0023EDE61D|nr:disintegrin and metalloproteinase domain-containing protein 8 [Pteronotus parnellii mesoamericanus]
MLPGPRVAAPARAMRRLGLWLLGALWLQAAARRGPLPHVAQYEEVRPQRLPGPRVRRALPSGSSLYPESVSYVIGARGQNFTLHLRKNRDLLASRYTETYSAANGSQVTEPLQGQDHCFYQGHVEGHPLSAASLSTCDGLRGFFQVGSAVRLIEPLHGGGEEGPHALYEAQHLRPEAGTCGVSNASLDSLLGLRTSAAFRPRNWPRSQEPRYVELYVVADYAEFQRLKSRDAVRSRVLEVVNHVDKLYQELGFRVVLVGLDIWDGGDKIVVSSNPSLTLENFLAWRTKHLVGRHAHDNAQLLTGVDFSGQTVGLAKVSTMCSRHSGAVNQDHSGDSVGVACTMAHEMGHNLGMNHDDNVQGCYCPAAPSRQCVMAASIRSPYPQMFSHCSRADLQMFVEKLPTTCLANAPDLDRLVGGPKCGNGFVERGEQCDCGQPQDCQNRCCNATTCRLAEGAECAHGACCHECKVRPAGQLCRPPKDACDLEERCDGRQPACPEDAFQENGTPCGGGYCYNGACPTRAQRCRDLWGPGSRTAAERCYAYSLLPDCNGGTALHRAQRAPCDVLFCEGGQVPSGRSYCTISGACQALFLDGGSGYERVLEGTQCGDGRVCWRGQCQGLHVYRSENCSAQCSGHGVCNHKGKCHCLPGWAPPHCSELLAEVRTASRSLLLAVLLPVLLLVALGLALAAVAVRRKAGGRVRRRHVAPKTSLGRSNPLFPEEGSRPAEGGAAAPTVGPPGPVAATHTGPGQPPRPTASAVTSKRPPPPPPAPTSHPPFPVPVYTQRPPAQLRPAPPTKPLPELKPTQVVRPTCVPPKPPVKPRAQGANAGATEGAVGPKVALKPPVQRR